MSSGDGGTLSDGPLATLLANIEDFCRSYSPASDPATLGDHLVRLRAGVDRLELAFSEAAGAFAATDEYEVQGAATPIEWVRHHTRMTGAAAADRVCVGQQLERLPLSAESMVAGTIGFGHLVPLARAAHALTTSKTSAGFDEASLLPLAEEMSVGKFGFACHHYRHAQDPEGYAKDEAAAAELRELTLTTGPDGRLFMKGSFDAAGGAVVRTALEALAKRAGADDDRLIAQRLADAQVEAMSHVMDTGAVPQRASQRTHLQVTAPLETVLGRLGAPAGDMEFSLPISAKAVEGFACDCALTRVLLNADSIPIDVGRSVRVVSSSTRRALNVLYKCCGFPGCDRPVSWTQAHHIWHWTKGGETNLDNLVPLCYRHHWMVHEGGWHIVKMDTGILAVPPPGNRVRRVTAPDNFAVVTTGSLSP